MDFQDIESSQNLQSLCSFTLSEAVLLGGPNRVLLLLPLGDQLRSTDLSERSC